MKYDLIIAKLKSCHFTPDELTHNGKVVALHIPLRPFMATEQKQRLEEVLKDYRVTVTAFPNNGFLEIREKKVT